jgi:DNA repair protein RadC
MKGNCKMKVPKSSKYSKDNFYRLLKSGRFADMVKESSENKKVNNSIEVYNILKPLMAKESDVEQFWIIFLDAKNKIIEMSCMFKGTLTIAAVYPREVVKKIISTGASAIICSHNHPSGDPVPSAEDYSITFQLLIAVKSMGATIHEHIIIGDGKYHSMADEGAVAKFNQKYDRLFERG